MQTIDSVFSLPTSIDSGVLQSFCARAGVDVAGVRRGILLVIQDQRSVRDLDTPIREVNSLRQSAHEAGLPNIEELCRDCEVALAHALKTQGTTSVQSLNLALDLLAEIEAAFLESSLSDDDPFPDVSGFIDASFEQFSNGNCQAALEAEPELPAEFEIDEETLEIFRSEASDLLENISANLESLTSHPDDRDALWNIRRCAHTFKGAAGIVGMKEASELAHRVEDLLDQLAENQCKIDIPIIDLLTASTDCLNSMTVAPTVSDQPANLSAIYDGFERVISQNAAQVAPKKLASDEGATASEHSDFVKTMPAPIVRVGLARLDELLRITRELDRNRTALAESFAAFHSLASDAGNGADTFEKIGTLFEIQHRLTSEMQDKLLGIRMVRFGMLITRLNRAVHVTCQEEGKKAAVVIENEDVEIDTQILDSLVEPLLHLLRNAVVHGIELPEMRRMIGKPETGQIRIKVDNREDFVDVSVCDDGRGISGEKLKEKAVSSGALSRDDVASMTNQEALELMFLRGVTTADTLSMNAGRGVGMSIVKESVESGGGSISVTSESQKGTTFTIKMPLAVTTEHSERFVDAREESKEQTIGDNSDLTVLIVDDSPGMRQLITKIIEKAGWRAITASHGLDALEKLGIAANRPDIVLTDLEMPCLNGYELLEALKKDNNLRDIPVVMITSRTDPDYRLKAFDLGVADFLTKPFEGSSLIKIVKQLTAVTAS